jgi:hypothetical protein
MGKRAGTEVGQPDYSGKETKKEKKGASYCKSLIRLTLQIPTAFGLEFFPPAPYRVKDETHAVSATHF